MVLSNNTSGETIYEQFLLNGKRLQALILPKNVLGGDSQIKTARVSYSTISTQVNIRARHENSSEVEVIYPSFEKLSYIGGIGLIYDRLSFEGEHKILAISQNCARFGYREKPGKKYNLDEIEINYKILLYKIYSQQPKIVHLQECLYNPDFVRQLRYYGYSIVYIPTVFFSDDKNNSVGILTAYRGWLEDIDVSVIFHPQTSYPDLKNNLKGYSIEDLSYWSIAITEKKSSICWVNIHNTAFGNQVDRFATIFSIMGICFKQEKNANILGDINLYGIDSTPGILPRSFNFIPCLLSVIKNSLLQNAGNLNYPNDLEIVKLQSSLARKKLGFKFYHNNKPSFYYEIGFMGWGFKVPWLLDGLFSNYLSNFSLTQESLGGCFDHDMLVLNLNN